MTAPPFSFSELTSELGANGLEILGTFRPDDGEVLFSERAIQPRLVAIVGNVGSGIWPPFEAARQNRPALALDRWTEGTVGRIAGDHGLDAVYPFQGPPYHPFIRWARRTGTLFSSPIGLTIHPTYGLWLAFRAALLIDHPVDDFHVEPVPARHPCDVCPDKPCLSTCPVGAFGGEGYDFSACLDHVATPVNACREGGCLARAACPVGRDFRYGDDHAAFHMSQLLKAHGRL